MSSIPKNTIGLKYVKKMQFRLVRNNRIIFDGNDVAKCFKICYIVMEYE